MDKEEALDNFLKGLRVVINNAFAYQKDHPYFVESVDTFRQKVNSLLSYLNPIKLGITDKSLFLDGRYWQKPAFYVQLAQTLHLRKIKAIEFKEGLTNAELINFFTAVSIPMKEVLQSGGTEVLLNREKTPHIYVEELDYSELLQSQGEVAKDIWAYLFRQAASSSDPEKVNSLAGNFPKIISQFNEKDLCLDKELRQDLESFFQQLSATQKEKFFQCSKELFQHISKFKHLLGDEDVLELKIFFQRFHPDDFSELLWQELLSDDSFDTLSFRLFSLFAGEANQQAVASALEQKAVSKKALENNPKAVKKIQDLLSVVETQNLPETYRRGLSLLVKDIALQAELSFDRRLLQQGYRAILLNLLRRELDKEKLGLVSQALLKELKQIAEEKNFSYLKSLSDALRQNQQENPSLSVGLEELKKSTSSLIESFIWEKGPAEDLISCLETLEDSSLDAAFYLDKIFKEGKTHPAILKLFFKFFPGELKFFYQTLESRFADLEFMQQIIGGLAAINSPASLAALKDIFPAVNQLTKIEILKAIPGTAEATVEFLVSGLLTLPSPWGSNNDLLLANLTIIEEARPPQAKKYLQPLTRRRFFWNSKLRRRAGEILKKYYGKY